MNISKFKITVVAGVFLFSLAIISGCASKLCIAPYPLPHVKAKMHTPGYWISKTDNQDKVIMSAEQIEKFNEINCKKRTTLGKVIMMENTMTGRQL